jgi:hypothetical protein
VGVKDLVVVTTPDAVLVLPQARAQEEVKGLVAKLKSEGHAEATNHRRHHPPLGFL